MNPLLLTLLRTVLMYAAILAAVRLMGKRQISQLQTSELVVALLISELAVLPIQSRREPLWTGLAPMLALALCEIAVAFFMLKSGWFRRLVCGKPTLVIEDGKILQAQMKKLRMSNDELFEQLRQNGVFSLEEVAFAIVETNGTMSVARKAACDFLTPGQLGVKTKPLLPEVVVVSDGEILKSSVRLCGRDEAWVRRKIAEAGLQPEQVYLMTARRSGEYQIIKKEPP